jgi:bifunctional DNA-binding transcriptional regulator/antitoxin component of YhaV-PrlF toxin-antitoxin module
MGYPQFSVGGMIMSTAVLDERDRVVLPREVVEELGASKGDVVAFERRGGHFVIVKAPSKKARIDEIMDWNPKRTGKVEDASPKAMKKIWKT